MEKFDKYARIYHWLIFACFILPFFHTGCSDTANTPAYDVTSSDSIETVSKPLQKDTIGKVLSTVDSLHSNAVSANNSKEEQEEDNVSQKLIKLHPALKPILVPKKNTYSGVSVILDLYSVFWFFGTT